MLVNRGETVLITGASSGLGETFARVLARRGLNLILVARSQAKLQSLATELSGQYGSRVEVIAVDLSREMAPLTVYKATQQLGLTVDLLINNAGLGFYGFFEQSSLEEQHEIIMVNVTATLELTRVFLPAMLAKNKGAVINVSALAAFQPMPRMATYAASKAFILSLSEALWAEYRHRGVHILALCPGPMQTPFDDRLAPEFPVQPNRLTPERVVEEGLKALERGQHYLVVGKTNYLISNLPRLLPRVLVARILDRLFQPRKITATARRS